jgi:hypothetical protein
MMHHPFRRLLGFDSSGSWREEAIVQQEMPLKGGTNGVQRVNRVSNSGSANSALARDTTRSPVFQVEEALPQNGRRPSLS